ncbi:hypothetical protein [Streptomyces griseoaurantiacus]|nr:hypothetical protein [Streptomyces griseoaurantiacus]
MRSPRPRLPAALLLAPLLAGCFSSPQDDSSSHSPGSGAQVRARAE